MIADDDRVFRERLGNQLKGTGITVFMAEDGNEARSWRLQVRQNY